MIEEFGLQTLEGLHPQKAGKTISRELAPHELMAISERYHAEFSQVVLEDGSVRLFKGTEDEVRTFLSEGDWGRIRYKTHTHPGDLNARPSSQDITTALEINRNLEIVVRDYRSGRSVRVTWTPNELRAYQATGVQYRELMLLEKLIKLGLTRRSPP